MTVLPNAATATRRLTDDALVALDAWWRAANYLSVGQIYLRTTTDIECPKWNAVQSALGRSTSTNDRK